MKLDIEKVFPFVDKEALKQKQEEAVAQLKILKEKTGKGSDFLAWLDLPQKISLSEIDKINKIAANWKSYDAVVVVGIGGSYLGAKAVIEVLSKYFEKNDAPEMLFAGHQLDENYLSELLEYLADKNYGIIVISKSGTTLEPALAFRLLLNQIKDRFTESAIKERVIAITDVQKGALRKLVTQYDLESFIVPDDIGGRYSVLTAVGLLPIAVAGWNIKEMIKGASEMQTQLQEERADNIAISYAAIRNLLYEKGFTNEVLAYSVQRFRFFAEWWKQLFGESEGKEQKGIFPVSLNYTTDLHSLGQYMQEGERKLFETFIRLSKSDKTLTVSKTAENYDELNYLAGKTVHHINSKAEEGTIEAHYSGGVPVLQIVIDDLSEKTVAELIYFFEISCAISGYLLGVNPFDQPGVEAYKKNMFALLGKK